MIELKNVSKTYRSKKGVAVEALKRLNLTLGGTGTVFLLGKSGCGKSTLLNLLGGLDNYDAGGEIFVDGRSTAEFTAKDYDEYRNRYVGFIFQEFNLLETMTVGENVAFALELQGEKADREKLAEAIREVGLSEDCLLRKVTELSGGQKQRVAIARALIKKPKLILADEPTGDLDSQTGEQIFGLLKELSDEVPVVVVTHDRESAERFADRTIELRDGSVISDSGFDVRGESESAERVNTDGSVSDRKGREVTGGPTAADAKVKCAGRSGR